MGSTTTSRCSRTSSSGAHSRLGWSGRSLSPPSNSFSHWGLRCCSTRGSNSSGWHRRPRPCPGRCRPSLLPFLLKLIYHPDAGILNGMLHSLGLITDSINWLGSFELALPAVIIVGVWAGMPQTTVTLLAALQGTPAELHEAASLDGAGAWRRFTAVTWPSIAPVAFAITALDFIWNFNSFGLVFVLTDGGPGGRTLLPMLFAYQRAFGNGEFGYASALGNVMVIVILAILGLYLRRQLRSAARA